MILSRIFAVLAAAFLVAAVAIVTLTPVGMTLAQGILQLDKSALDWARTHSPAWLWAAVELPFLLRPLWLVPACLCLICAGLAGSFTFRRSPSRQRRS